MTKTLADYIPMLESIQDDSVNILNLRTSIPSFTTKIDKCV